MTKWIANRTNKMVLRDLASSEIREMSLRAKGITRLTSGEPDFKTPDFILEAAKTALDDGHFNYTSAAGFPELREAIARKSGEDRDIRLDASEIMVTSGGAEAIFLTLMTMINFGDEILVPDPGYPPYESCVTFAGGKAVPYPLDETENGYRLNPNDIEKKITPRTKIIILNSPSNPTGMVINAEELHQIIELCQKHEMLVISDEAYEKILYDNIEHYSPMTFAKDQTILLNSFSKTYAMTGWRVGYIAANHELIENLLKVQTKMILCPSAIAQKAALAAITGPQECIRNMVEKYDERRRLVVRELNNIKGISCQMPKGAFYAFANTSALKMGSLGLCKLLLEKANVAVYPGVAYGDNGEHHIRLSFAVSDEVLSYSLEKIKRALEQIFMK